MDAGERRLERAAAGGDPHEAGRLMIARARARGAAVRPCPTCARPSAVDRPCLICADRSRPSAGPPPLLLARRGPLARHLGLAVLLTLSAAAAAAFWFFLR